MNHLFVLDPISQLNLTLDSSLRMAEALIQLGHQCFVTHLPDLYWHKGPGAGGAARCHQLSFRGQVHHHESVTLGPQVHKELRFFQAIHMRKDPPYDLDYIAATWVLDSHGSSTKIYNDPKALRSLNEKLSIFLFPNESRDALLSHHSEQLLEFIEKTPHQDGIIKPLDLFGGRGVQRLNLKADGMTRAKALEILRTETQNGRSARLVQAFDPAIFEGEVRAFAVCGEPLSWCLKKPAVGQFIATTRAGATLTPYHPTPAEIERVRRVSKGLLERGVNVVGFDIIGGYISEINLTSPRLLVGDGDETNYYSLFAQRIHQDLTNGN